MADYRFVTTVSADTAEQAEAVMAELCGYDYIETDLPRFAYEASCRFIGGTSGEPDVLGPSTSGNLAGGLAGGPTG